MDDNSFGWANYLYVTVLEDKAKDCIIYVQLQLAKYLHPWSPWHIFAIPYNIEVIILISSSLQKI